ncbi:MAG: hypothetical protein P8Z70_11635 [Desulfuromonadales bacterium]
MIDIHCHILPGLDDGPRKLDDSLEMARIAVADGIVRTVATPHINGFLHSPVFLRERVSLFNETLKKEGIPLEVLPGADARALLDPEILRDYTLNGTDYVLFEFPHSHIPQNAIELIFKAILAGLKPIITHPERNPTVILRPQVLFDLVEAGALVQCTAESLTGFFGPEVMDCCFFLLERRAVHFLASDAHSPRYRRPVLSRSVLAAEKIIGRAAARRLVENNPSAVVSGEAIYV